MSLDVGDERVGVALADSSIAIPHAFATYVRGEAEAKILSLINERKIEKVIVGIPLDDDGTEGPQCQKVRTFAKRLKKRCQAEFVYIDEYASSEEAKERIRESGRRITDKGMVDAAAAAIILQRYLESRS